MKRFLYHFGSWLSRGLSVLALVGAHWTFSAYSWSAGNDSKAWERMRLFIDFLFKWKEPTHCKRVWKGRVARAHETIARDAVLSKSESTRD